MSRNFDIGPGFLFFLENLEKIFEKKKKKLPVF